MEEISCELRNLKISKSTGLDAILARGLTQTLLQHPYLGFCFLDIRKVFDSVHHEILLHEMETQFGLRNVAYNCLRHVKSSQNVKIPITFK